MKATKKLFSVIICIACLTGVITSFSGCAQKTADKLEYKINDDGAAEIVSYFDITTRTEIVIPDDIDGAPVVKVRDFGVFNAESITKITIGKNVKEIGSWAFTNNQGLAEYEVSPENEYFTAVDGVLFTKDMKTLVFYPPAKNIEFDKYKNNLNTTTYEIPDGVETIRSKAFYKCYYVTDIKIPDSVKSIEEKAFHKVTALTSLTLPSSLEFIGKDAFAYCKALTSLVIPENVNRIDEYAFYNCSAITAVTMLCKEENVTLGKKWYPTNNGRELKEMSLSWQK